MYITKFNAMGRKPKIKDAVEKPKRKYTKRKNVDSINDIIPEQKEKRKYTKRKKSVEVNDETNIEVEKTVDIVNHYTSPEYIKNLRYDWVHPSTLALKKANKELNSNYFSWGELSSAGNLSEDFITRYANEIIWYNLFKNQLNFSEKFKNKFKDKFILVRLGLI